MTLFQPCPYHFPDLWKQGTLVMPEITSVHTQDARELYRLPEDNTEEAKMYFVPPSVLAEAYAKLLYQDPHGFLVENGQLVLVDRRVLTIDSLYLMRLAEGCSVGLLSEECFQRARTFSLPEETPRRGFPGGLAHGDMRRSLCIPCAKQTWP